MNREIKFRGWDGSKIIPPDATKFFVEFDGTVWQNEGHAEHDLLEYTSSSFQIMQFTGLKDRNEKDIYEGDIVRVLYTDWGSKTESDPRTLDQYLEDISFIGEVVFYCDRFCIGIKSNKYGDVGYNSIFPGEHGRIAVIGNIHQNPELLNQ